jgi:putative transposase
MGKIRKTYSQAKISNEKWVTDITYLQSNGIRLYLSAMKDLYNNEIVAYQISHRNDVKFVIDTVKLAIKRKKDVSGILHHSDQGFQYTSRQHHTLFKQYNIKASMSRKGIVLIMLVWKTFLAI